MLQFETLLVRQLQKQQNRDEFCDTVLHTPGVSVPVHSCVLSAFSPRLYGTLSTMPVPMAGQRRLIELQAVDACTLLSLVSLLYSGQIHENREQVLSAAQTLGIELPQWQEEERHGEKVGRRKARADADQEIEKEVDAREWDDDRMTRRMEEGSGGEKKKIRESGTQTECGRETDESGPQTGLACSEPQSSQTIWLIDQSTSYPNQEPGSYMNIHDTALALQAINPERKLTTCNVLATAPEITSSDPACLSQICLYSMETTHHQPSISVTPHPHNSFLDQSLVVPAAGADDINDLKQFEGNISGFISYFLDSTGSQNIGRRGRGCAREGAKEDQVVKRARARSTGGGSVREWVRCIGGGGRRGRRQRCTERWGMVARLAWQGQGGGRVGRLLQTRSRGKNQTRAFQQGNEALVEAGEARGRGRHWQRGKKGTISGSEGQNGPPLKRRPRGRPRICPLPPSSRSFSAMTPTKQCTVDPTELDLLHTATHMPTAQMEPSQPIDTLLHDIMTDLNFLPPADHSTTQHGNTSTTTSSGPPISKYPSSDSIKPTDPKQHLENELGDILDHFLRTFDQQVGCCSLDVGDESLQDKFDAGTDKSDPITNTWSNTPKTYTQLQLHNSHVHHQKPQANCLHASSTLSTQPQLTSTVNPSVAQKTNPQDHQIHESRVKKPSTDQNIVQQSENRRLTRSQSTQRKLEMALNNLKNPVKRKCKEKQSADNKTKRQRNDRVRSEPCANKSEVNNLNKNNKNKATHTRSEGRQKQVTAKRRHGRIRSGRRKSVENKSHRMAGFYERKKSPQERRPAINSCGETKKNVGEDHVEAEHASSGFQAGQSSGKHQIRGTCIEIASSATEKVRMLLQLQDEEEDEGRNEGVGVQRVNKVGNGKLVNHKSISGAEERPPDENRLQDHLGEIQETEDEGRVTDSREFEGQERINSIVDVSQRREDEERMANGLRQEEMIADECRSPFQLNLSSNAVFSAKEGNNDIESTFSRTESVTKVSGSWPGDAVPAQGVHLLQSVPPSTQCTMHKMADLTLDVGDAPRIASPARLSHTQPCQEPLSPHTSTKDLLQLAGSSVDEEDDVDVLEVSSPTSELPAVSPVTMGVDMSTEEEEVEDDVEIDVLGLEPD